MFGISLTDRGSPPLFRRGNLVLYSGERKLTNTFDVGYENFYYTKIRVVLPRLEKSAGYVYFCKAEIRIISDEIFL